MAKQRFKYVNFRSDALSVIDQCNEILDEYQEQGLTLTLRQLYYQFVSRDLFTDDRKWSQRDGKWVRDPNGSINADPNYKWLGGILRDARLAGLVDWDAIEDRGRQPRRAAEWHSLSSLVDSAVAAFRLRRWEGQDYYVELWVEKDALAGVLEPLSEAAHVTLMVNKGYSSLSAMKEAAERFQMHDNRQLVLFYIGDHDPSGEDMVRDVRDRLELFGVDVDVRKIALTMDQVKQYRPPPNPTKMSDSRARDYIAKFGRQCWEVDALPPDVLAKIVRSAFSRVIDRKKMDAIIAKEEEGKDVLREAASSIE